MEIDIKALESAVADAINHPSELLGVCLTIKEAQAVLSMLKEQEPKPVIQNRQCEVKPNVWERKGFCPKCHQVVLWSVNRLFCGFCGKAVKWNDQI